MKSERMFIVATRGSRGRAGVWVLLAVAVGVLVVHAALRDRAQTRRLERERREEWGHVEEQKRLFGAEERATIFAVNGPGTAATIHVEGRGDCRIRPRDAPRSEVWPGRTPSGKVTVPAGGYETLVVSMRERDVVALVVSRDGALERYEHIRPGVYLLILDHLDDCVGYESLTYSYPRLVLPGAKAPPPSICMKGLYLVDEESSRTIYSFDERPPDEIPSSTLGVHTGLHGYLFNRAPRDR